MRRLIAGLVLVAFAVPGCGGGGDDRRSGEGPLIWKGEALSVPAGAGLPDDHIVGGRVLNDSLRTIRLASREMRLVAEDGSRVRGVALGFIDHYAHGNYPPARRDQLATKEEREAEDRRLGRLVTLKPRQDAPLTVAWRQRDGAPAPVRIEYPGGSLPLPR